MKALLAVLLLATAVVAENQCPSEQESNWETIEKLLRHEDCNKFYKCTYGEPVELECYHGLYFNLDTWECDWPANVDCTGRIDPAEKSTEAIVESEELKAPETETSEEIANETEEAPQEPEEAKETDEAPETEEAPEESGQSPEVSEQSPEESEQSPEESKEESNQAPEESEQTPEESEQATEEHAKETDEDCDEVSEEQQPELEFQDNGCPVNPHVHWLLPHEDDCNQFYYCVWGQKQQRNCPASLHFNRHLQVCDWPADAACAVSANKHYGGRAVAFRNL